MRRFMPISVALLSVAALAMGSSAGYAASGAQDDEQKVTCKLRKQTGTRFPQKTCMTGAEWAAAEESAKRRASDMINVPKVNLERSN